MSDTRLRIIAIYRMFADGNRLTVQQIIEKLGNEYGITAERKSIYSDIESLTRFLPINKKRIEHQTYYGAVQQIEGAEMKTKERIRVLAVYTMFDTCDELTVPQIQERLEQEYKITAHRTTIYDDIEALKLFAPIMQERRGARTFYRADYTLWRNKK